MPGPRSPGGRSHQYSVVLVYIVLNVELQAQTGTQPKVPPDNPLRAESAEFGRRLFFDKQLSRDGTVSCATCHDPKRGFADDQKLARGIQGRVGERHTPSLIARGFGQSQFWDGRTTTLEEQVTQPITNPKEMDMTVEQAVERLRSVYASLSPKSLAYALATYVRTIRSENSPFDRFLRGDERAIGAGAREGFRLFRDKARCYICHAGDHFTDELFHNTGVAWTGRRLRDEGRAAVTGKRYHRGAFKTPTLREVALTAPYMHDGSIATLEQVVEFYDRGGKANPHLDENIQPLRLSAEEKRAIVAFLRTLSGLVRDGFER